MPLPLDGLRVLDLTQVMAGPFCTMILADLGADVVKVEPPGTGDLSRSMGGAGMRVAGGAAAPFVALNRNKRSIVLDLQDGADRARFHTLVRGADIVVENFRPGTAERLGADYATLAAIRPDVIYGSISGFGRTGPYADRPGFDLIAQAMSGIMSVTGEPGGPPVKCGVPVSDLAAGLYLAVALLAAVVQRQRTGLGQHVETSLYEAALALSVWETAELWAIDEVPRAMGSAHRLSAPYQALRTRDSHLVVAALTERQWRGLCNAIDRPMLADDARFATNAARMRHRADLAAELEAALAGDDTAAWVERLLAAGVPAGPIHDCRQATEDAHTRARDMVVEIEGADGERTRALGSPVKLSGSRMRVQRPPPRLGEHTVEVMRDAGLHDGTAGAAP